MNPKPRMEIRRASLWREIHPMDIPPDVAAEDANFEDMTPIFPEEKSPPGAVTLFNGHEDRGSDEPCGNKAGRGMIVSPPQKKLVRQRCSNGLRSP